MVEKVWFSDGEEKDLLGALRFLEETRGKPIVNQYEELQKSVVDFVKSSVDYKFGRNYSGWNPISKIWAAEQVGEPFNKEDPFIAPGYTLMHEHTRLSGLVEEFKRELRRMVLNWTP